MARSVALSTLLGEVTGVQARQGDTTVTGVACDSRRVVPGDLFVAYRGFEADGHDFIASALAGGAVAVVLDDPRYIRSVAAVPWARVDNARRACAELAAAYHQHPSTELLLVGVTGTNGKTTTTFFIDAILSAAGMRGGVIGTLGYGSRDDLREAPRTTPDSVELQTWLRRMADRGFEGVAMEVSSHSLVLYRPWRCAFDAVVFTNLSQDHLDFHADLGEYLEAKLLLFTEYARDPRKATKAAVNLDDAFGPRIAQSATCPVLGYGLGERCAVRALDVSSDASGSRFTLAVAGERVAVELSLPGLFNVYNALGAAAAAHAMGIGPEAIAAGLAAMRAVPGRFERVDAGQPFTIIVDYAHTPQALENALRVARQLGPRRLICVFGCGGDRDPDKRPRMGRIATELADLTIVTSDNPRSEDPLAIIQAVTAGALGEAWSVQPDRREAIGQALAAAEPGDLVLIAGKGHETYQIFADRTIDFDDRKVARELAGELFGQRRVRQPG
ncbi:MAG: UDP-N-acetylmuramoyl-L-alanyl-D-glutamate--2,6-diaminopimelate ligase [Armatimonadota bacterium]